MVRLPRSARGLARVLSLATAAVALAEPAHAQFGSIRRAVERNVGERVEQRVQDKANLANLREPTFDGTTIELTDELLDRYVAALARRKAQQPELQRRADALRAVETAQRDSAARLENAAARRSFETANERYAECAAKTERAEREAVDRRSEQLMQRFQANPVGAQSDPTGRRIIAAMQVLANATDTAAVARAQRELIALGIGTDSATVAKAVTAACGAAPVAPAWLRQQEALNARAAATRKEHERLASSAVLPTAEDLMLAKHNASEPVGAEQLKLMAAIINDRIQAFLGGSREFTRGEYERLVARRDAIQKAMRS